MEASRSRALADALYSASFLPEAYESLDECDGGHEGLSEAERTRPTIAAGCARVQRPSEAEVDRVLQTHDLPAVPPSASVKFLSFARLAFQRCVCVDFLELPGRQQFIVAFPPYNADTCAATNGKPVLLHADIINGDFGSMAVQCPCPADRLATMTTERDVMGLEGGICWHKRALGLPGAVKLLTENPFATSDPSTGLPSTVVVCVISVKTRRGAAVSADTVPDRAYVFVSGPTGPGLRRAGILILTKQKHVRNGRGFSISCDVCGEGSKPETGKENCRACLHFKGLKDALDQAPLLAELALVKTLLSSSHLRRRNLASLTPPCSAGRFPHMNAQSDSTARAQRRRFLPYYGTLRRGSLLPWAGVVIPLLPALP